MPQTTRAELSGALLAALLADIRSRTGRADAASEIHIDAVPMRTCYESMTRLKGPSHAVLDYAAHLFAEDARGRVHPTPELTVDEAQIDTETGIMTLVLTRGTFVSA